MNNLEFALHYAEEGWHVFPLVPNTKVPFEKSSGFKAATTDLEQITEWWTTTPNANIGIATGAVSGLWVLDIDTKDGKDGTASLRAFLEQRQDATAFTSLKQKTATGGAHILFKYIKPIGNRANILGGNCGLDIRGDGGYIVAAPSITSDGAYRWSEFPTADAIAEAPQWAIELADFDHRSPSHKRSDSPNKVDKAHKLPWDTSLGFRGNPSMTLADTEVGRKYICRCPFHDDRSASAAFWRKTNTFGYLFCSACDTTWVTDTKRLSADEATSIHERIAQLNKQLKEMK